MYACITVTPTAASAAEASWTSVDPEVMKRFLAAAIKHLQVEVGRSAGGESARLAGLAAVAGLARRCV
jgi:hypothetical protein